MENKVIEVCLGVGMGQIFPEITRIVIEDSEEMSKTKVKPVDTEIGREFMTQSDLTIQVENPKRRGRKKKSE